MSCYFFSLFINKPYRKVYAFCVVQSIWTGIICLSCCLKSRSIIFHSYTQTFKNKFVIVCVCVLALGLTNRQINRFDECKSLVYVFVCCVSICNVQCTNSILSLYIVFSVHSALSVFLLFLFWIGYHIFRSMFYWCRLFFLFSSLSSVCSVLVLFLLVVFDTIIPYSMYIVQFLAATFDRMYCAKIRGNHHRFSRQKWDSRNMNTNESLLLVPISRIV